MIYLDPSINLLNSHDLILFHFWYRILFTLTSASVCGPLMISYCSIFDTGYYLPWHQHKSVDLSQFHTVPFLIQDIIYLDISINLWTSHDFILFHFWYRILFTLTSASICGPLMISYCSMFDTGYYLPWHLHQSVDLSWFHTVPFLIQEIIYLDTSINLWTSHDFILFHFWYRILFTLTPASICGPLMISYCLMFDTGYYLPWHLHQSVDLSWFHTVPFLIQEIIYLDTSINLWTSHDCTLFHFWYRILFTLTPASICGPLMISYCSTFSRRRRALMDPKICEGCFVKGFPP